MLAPESIFWICLGKCAHWLLEIQDSRNRLSEWGDPKLDFVQLRSIAERFSEALQQCAWDCNQIGLLLGR